MLAIRFIGGIFLLAAVIALTADLSRPRRPGAPSFASVERHWQDLAPQSLAATEKSIVARLHPAAWDPVAKTLLSTPAFALLGGLAAGLLYLGRRRRRVEIFIN